MKPRKVHRNELLHDLALQHNVLMIAEEKDRLQILTCKFFLVNKFLK